VVGYSFFLLHGIRWSGVVRPDYGGKLGRGDADQCFVSCLDVGFICNGWLMYESCKCF
jgi:hypothetical protein